MNKNRRKSNYTPISNLFDTQNYHSQFKQNCHPDQQNQAKLILLGIGNQDADFHDQFALDDFEREKDKMPCRMKVSGDKKYRKSLSKYSYQHHENILSQIDDNANYFHVNNFIDDNKPKQSTKKQRFSMRNIKSKENISYHGLNPIQETKREQKTIFKLKKILKKLQSPQKLRKSSDCSQFQVIQSIMKPKKANRISCCSSQLQKTSKQNNLNQKQINFFTNSRLLSKGKEHQQGRGFDTGTDSRTSYEKKRNSAGKMMVCMANEAQTKFFHKSNKLTNQTLIFKRNSLNTGELVKKNCYTQPFKKSSRQASSYQQSNYQSDKSMFEDVFIQQEKIKEERKSRNLKNILFD